MKKQKRLLRSNGVSKIKVVVFDFDGVLVDSEDMKRKALKDSFMEIGENFAQKIFEYQQLTGANRYDVSSYAADKLGEDKNWAERYSQKYSDIVREKIIKMPKMSTCESTLLTLAKKYPLYISSATPKDELNKILVAKTMRHMFKEALGGPESKVSHFSSIIAKENIDAEEILFIGDSESDAKIADIFGLDFLAINYRGDKSKVIEIEKLFDIVGYLKKNEDLHTKFRYSY